MPRRSNDCSARGVVNKFNKLGYMTNISRGISTGNKLVDKQIAKYTAKAVNLMVKDPRSKIAVKVAEKIYPYTETGGANVARAIAAYRETCKKRK